MIEIGKVVYCNHHWNDRDGYFVVESVGSPGRFICRRIMKSDGTIIKASKLRPSLEVKDLTLVTGDAVQLRYDNQMARYRNQADTELKHLMKYIG